MLAIQKYPTKNTFKPVENDSLYDQYASHVAHNTHHMWIPCLDTFGFDYHLFAGRPRIEKSHLAVHERVDSRFLVLAGSKSTITEITEYTCFSPLKPRREFKY